MPKGEKQGGEEVPGTVLGVLTWLSHSISRSMSIAFVLQLERSEAQRAEASGWGKDS